MGGKKSSPAPVPAPAPAVQTPSVDIAQVAAEKALAAQGNLQAQNGGGEDKKRKAGLGGTRPERDPASVANTAPAGGIGSSAILTG